MSHGFGSYEVENAQRRERERQAAMERCNGLQLALVQVEAKMAIHAELGEASTTTSELRANVPPAGATTEAFAAWNSRTQRIVDRLEGDLRDARHSEWAADLERHLSSIANSGVKATRITAASSPASGKASKSNGSRLARRDIAADIALAVASLNSEATEDEQGTIERAADSAVQADPDTAATLLTELKALIHQVDRRVEERRSWRMQGYELLLRLDGIEGPSGDPEIGDLRRLMKRVIGGETPLVASDIRRVADARARAIADEDRRYVAEQLSAAFAEFGYSISNSFQVDLARGESAYAFVESSADHAAEVTLSSGQFSFRMVHTSETADTSADISHEASLCKAMGVLSMRAENSGVHLSIAEHHGAGVDPIPFSKPAAELRPGIRHHQSKVRERER